MAFSNILPDPVNKITEAGVVDNSTGNAGPGFANVALRSVQETQVSRTRTGRGVTRSQGGQYWEFDIKYNEMTRDQFEPVYSFLLSRNGRKSPFFVALPQYASSRSTAFAAIAAANTIWVKTAASAGDSNITVKNLNMGSTAPKQGDLFNITDVNDTNHTKAYRITRVESNTIYETAGLASTERRIWFTPPLSRDVATGLATVTSTSVSNPTFTKAGHGLTTGQKIRAVSGLTGGLTADTIYFVSSAGLTANTFRLTTTAAFAVAGTNSVTLTNTTNTTFQPSPTELVMTNPLIRCILRSDIQEHELDTNNLYEFSLSLEEIEP
jgi:hypothetical protein